MFPSYVTFERNLETIVAQLEFLRSQQAALRLGARLEDPANANEQALRDLALAAQRSTPKRFTHTWAVVELYGAIEQLVEGIVRDYLLKLQDFVPAYEKLPARILETHTRKSFELLQNGDRLGRAMSEREVVANLHTCLKTTGNYRLNRDAFALHTANVRSEQIKSMFAQIGVDGVPRRAYETEAFQKFLETLEAQRKEDRRDGQELRELDALVELRNEAAHGVPSNLLSVELLEGYARFTRAFGTALVEVVEEEAAKLAVEHQGRRAGAMIDVFRSRIVCLQLEQSVRVGEVLVGRTPDNRFRSGPILRIEIAGTAVSVASKGEQVGLEVAFHAKNNQEFFVLAAPRTSVGLASTEPKAEAAVDLASASVASAGA